MSMNLADRTKMVTLAVANPIVELDKLPERLVINVAQYQITFDKEDTEHLRRLL